VHNRLEGALDIVRDRLRLAARPRIDSPFCKTADWQLHVGVSRKTLQDSQDVGAIISSPSRLLE